jgi:hypothetical protein
MIQLATEQLFIRNFAKDDWKDLFEIGLNYEESEYAKFDHGPWPDSPDVYKGIVESWSKTTESCKVILKYVFQVLKAYQINTGTAKNNIPSYNLLKRLGFSPIGEELISFRKDEEGIPIKFVGVEFTISRKDWLESQKPNTG